MKPLPTDFWPEVQQAGLSYPPIDRTKPASIDAAHEQQVANYTNFLKVILSLPSTPKHSLRVTADKRSLDLTFLRTNAKGYDVRLTVDENGPVIRAGGLLTIPSGDSDEPAEDLALTLGMIREQLSPTCRLREKHCDGKIIWSGLDAWSGEQWDELFSNEAEDRTKDGQTTRRSFVNRSMPPRPGSVAPPSEHAANEADKRAKSRYFDRSMISHYVFALVGIVLLITGACLHFFELGYEPGRTKLVMACVVFGLGALYMGGKGIWVYTNYRNESKKKWD